MNGTKSKSRRNTTEKLSPPTSWTCEPIVLKEGELEEITKNVKFFTPSHEYSGAHKISNC